MYMAASYRQTDRFYKSSGFSPGSVHASFPLSDIIFDAGHRPNLVLRHKTGISFWISLLRYRAVAGRANMSELAYSARAVDLHLLVDSRCFEASKASNALHDASSSNTHTPPRALR